MIFTKKKIDLLLKDNTVYFFFHSIIHIEVSLETWFGSWIFGNILGCNDPV